jgi:hypothetical protein
VLFYRLINTNKFKFLREGGEGGEGGAEKGDEEKKKEKIDLKVSTKFQNNPSTFHNWLGKNIWKHFLNFEDHPTDQATI